MPFTTNVSTLAAFFASTALVSASATALTLHYTVRKNILDIPNHRSSHTRPTPRGAGIAIVGVVIATLLGLIICGILPLRLGLSLLFSSATIAALGGLDDIYTLPPRIRLGGQIVAACIAVWGIFPFGQIPFANTSLAIALAISLIFVIAIVWMTNLYNFMDGIDGIAGIQATVAALSTAALLYQTGWWAAACVAMAIGGASAGFLIFNWSPARIFMGDVGSGFLGFMFAALTVMGYRHSFALSLLLLMPLLPFIVDATATLLLRFIRGAPVAVAHREHMYQLAVQAGASHQRVAGAVGASSAILAIMAWFTAYENRSTLQIVIVAVIVTVITYVVLRSYLLHHLSINLEPHHTSDRQREDHLSDTAK
jgi:Fuc2NAc and GlcNAc transferase